MYMAVAWVKDGDLQRCMEHSVSFAPGLACPSCDPSKSQAAPVTETPLATQGGRAAPSDHPVWTQAGLYEEIAEILEASRSATSRADTEVINCRLKVVALIRSEQKDRRAEDREVTSIKSLATGLATLSRQMEALTQGVDRVSKAPTLTEGASASTH